MSEGGGGSGWRRALVGLPLLVLAALLWTPATASAVGCDGDIVFGERISCPLPTTSSVQDLTFAGTDGDQVRVRVIQTGGTVNPISSIRLGAGTVCASTFSDQYTCELTSTGTHTLRIEANGSGTGTVATTIQRLNNPTPCPVIAFDATGVTSTIAQTAEIDCRARAGAVVGQRWRIRVVETSGAATLIHEVVRPDGTTVCAGTGAVESSCLIDTAGTHRILVYDSSGLQTGDYRIVLEKFPAPVGCTALTVGTPLTVNLNNPGELICLTFAGVNGDRFRVRSISTAGAWNPVTEMFRADGTTVCANTFSDQLDCALDSGGNHTILVRDATGNGEALGTGRVVIQRLNNPTPCPVIAFDATGVTSTIAQTAEIDCRARAGAVVGQRWRIRVVETSGAATLIHEVVRPDGTTVCAGTGAVESSCLIDTAGTHRILVYDSSGLQTGDYRIVLEKFPAPVGCTALTVGTPLTVNLNNPGELICLTFAGVNGDRFRVRSISTAGAWNPVTEMFRADGTTVCANTFSDQLDCALDSGGNHTILVRDATGNGEALGTGRVVIQRLNNPTPCPVIAFDATGVTSTIAQTAEIDCRARAGAVVGQRWRIRVVETSGAATLIHEVVRPDGTTVCAGTGAVESSCLIDTAGTHRILVYDSSGLQTGDYRIVLEKFPAPVGCTALTVGTPLTVNLNNPGELICLTFAGVNGDRFRVRSISTAGAWNPVTEMFRADGTTVCANTFSDQLDCALDSGGNHTILVRDATGNGEALGTGRVVIQRLNNPTPCPVIAFDATGVTSTIAQTAEIDCRARAGAVVGQRWRIRVVETSGAATLIHEVVRPDGTTVCAGTGAVESSCLIDTAGTHRILVYDSSGLQTGDYRIVLEKFPAPVGCTALTVGTPLTVNLNNPGELICLTFAGVNGDRFRVRSISTAGAWNPVTEMFRADGTTVCANTFSDQLDCALDSGGNHTILVRDATGNGEALGTGRVVIQRLNNPTPCPVIAFDATGVTSTIAQTAEIDCRARAGAVVGQRWRIRVVETSGAATLIHEVVRPDGTTVCAGTGAVESSCLIDTAGTHRILVYDSSGLQTGDYRIVLEKFPAPVGCTAVTVGAAPVLRSVSDPGALDCLTFTGANGDNIRVKVISQSGAWNPVTEVFRPNGTTVCANTFADQFDCLLDGNGNHTILVRDASSNGEATGTYTVELDAL